MPTTAARSAAFEQTYSEYRGLMFALAKRILGDAALAEDAVSDASIKVLEHYDCLEEPVGPRTRRTRYCLTPPEVEPMPPPIIVIKTTSNKTHKELSMGS